MLRSITAILTLILLSCCTYKIVKRIDSDEIQRVIILFSEKMRYEHQLQLDDSIIYYDEHVNRIKLNFSSMEVIYLREARELIVDLVEDFIGKMNANLQIASSLGPEPFAPESLEIYIRFVPFYNTLDDLYTIGLITLRNGIVHLVATDAFDCEHPCWRRRREYYYQSRNIVNFSRQGDALYKPAPPVGQKSVFGEQRFYPSATKPSVIKQDVYYQNQQDRVYQKEQYFPKQ